MKHNYLTLALACTAVFTVIGCGGDNDDDRFVAGTYVGAVTRTSDTCLAPSPLTRSFRNVVNQNEEIVTLADGNDQYVGNLVGDDGFSADRLTTETIGGVSCTVTSRYEYSELNDDDDLTANVNFTIIQECPNDGDCEVTYEGQATR